MKATIVGAGPAGLFLALALARRGHQVTIVDRDRGPVSALEWPRTGVMQFRLPHFFRPQVRDALLAEAPEVVGGLLDAGAELTPVNPLMPDFAGFRVRRLIFERVLRSAVAAEPGVTMVTGHADQVKTTRSQVTGVVVDGGTHEADLVVDASGRYGRFTDSLRAPALGGNCGFAYVSRQYQLRPGAGPGPLNGAPGWAGVYDGYRVIVFLQDAGTFQVLIVRRTDDEVLARLRDNSVFDAAATAIPSVEAWIDPERATPDSSAMSGARLHNGYRGQLTVDGTVAAAGLLFVGDAVLTTNPAAGRGVTTSLLQAQRLLKALDEHGHDLTSVSLEFDQWCTQAMKPWFGRPRPLGRRTPVSMARGTNRLQPASSIRPDLLTCRGRPVRDADSRRLLEHARWSISALEYRGARPRTAPERFPSRGSCGSHPRRARQPHRQHDIALYLAAPLTGTAFPAMTPDLAIGLHRQPHGIRPSCAPATGLTPGYAGRRAPAENAVIGSDPRRS